MNECLDYLNANMEALLSRIETLHSHRAATDTIMGAARRELARPVKQRSEDEVRSSARRRKSAASPVRARSDSFIRRRRSSGAADEPAVEALLRALSVALPPEVEGRERIAALEAVLRDKEGKLADVEESAQRGFEEAVRVHLHDARRAVGLLWGCVLGDSKYGQVRLVDEDVEASVGVMEGEVEAVTRRVTELEGQRGVAGKSEKRAELLERWGSR